MAISTIADCPSCGYPIGVSHEGQTVVCANCGSKVQAAISEGVTIPTPLFVGIVAFGFGVLLGPSLIATTSAGQKWLQGQASKLG
jgi:DNA-directed RNA polymerase subunit RPC12/RpoP